MTERRTEYAHPLLAVTLVVLLAMVVGVYPRPQALRVEEELHITDRRWDEPTQNQEVLKLRDIAKSFRASKSLDRALTEVLEGLSEEELRVLEKALVPTEELPQGDMPIEDLVDDGPQELPGDETDEGLAEYRGELLVLDNINSTNPGNISEPGEETFYPQLQKLNREKMKEIRLATIKNQIMNILWPVGTPPSLSNMTMPQPPKQDILRILMKNSRNTFIPEDVYTEKVQSFYPSCEVPRNTDAELWNEGDAMNLLFDLTYPSSLHGTQVNIVAAKLRLYKLPMGNMTVVSDDAPSEEDSAKSFSASTTLAEDKMVRVSVYRYTSSLKRHRVKRKLLDSQMLPASKETWTEWNIKGAVKAWRELGRNFGLTVVVEDEDGNLLSADKYFAPMNCSQEASTSRPIPGFLFARALSPDLTSSSPDPALGQALHIDTMLFPMIDLCTVELPDYERSETAFYHKVVDYSELGNRRPQRRGQNSTVDGSETSNTKNGDNDKHKVRHYSHRQTEENRNVPAAPPRHLQTIRRDDGDSIEEITWADDLDGHQLRKQIIVQKVIKKNQNFDQESDR